MLGCKYFQWCHIHLGSTNRKQHYFQWASTRYFTIEKPVKLQKNNLFFAERAMCTGVATAESHTVRKTLGNTDHWHEVQVNKFKFVQNAHFTRIYIKSQKINRKSKFTQSTTILSKRRTKGYTYQYQNYLLHLFYVNLRRSCAIIGCTETVWFLRGMIKHERLFRYYCIDPLFYWADEECLPSEGLMHRKDGSSEWTYPNGWIHLSFQGRISFPIFG